MNQITGALYAEIMCVECITQAAIIGLGAYGGYINLADPRILTIQVFLAGIIAKPVTNLVMMPLMGRLGLGVM